MRNWIALFENARIISEINDDYLEHYGIPEDIVHKYSEGSCMYLALAMNLRFGWPIMCQMDADLKYIAHAYCQMPDGREIDILGPQTIVDRYDDHLVEWSREQMEAHIQPTADDMREANEAIDLYIEPKL